MSAMTKHDRERIIDMRNNKECWKLLPEFASQANLFWNSSQGSLGSSSSQLEKRANFEAKFVKQLQISL